MAKSIAVIFTDDSIVPNSIVMMDMEQAEAALRNPHVRVTRIAETASIGCYSVTIWYESILVNAAITFVS